MSGTDVLSNDEQMNTNMWVGGSHGGRGSYSNSNHEDHRPRGGGSYRGSFGNNNARRSGGYGFRRQNNNWGQLETQTDAVFIQNLPKSITRDEILDIFSTVGPIKIDDRSGGPKIWIYKDRDTGEPNGRATVTYEDDDTANRAISKYNDQHVDSIGAVLHVQLAQRRTGNSNNNNYNNNNDRGGRDGYRGGRNNWRNDNFSRSNFNSDGSRWTNMGSGPSDHQGGSGGGFRDMGGNSSGFSGNNDRGGSYRGPGRYNGGASNYAPY